MFFFILFCDLIDSVSFLVGLFFEYLFNFVDVNLLIWRRKVVEEIYMMVFKY